MSRQQDTGDQPPTWETGGGPSDGYQTTEAGGLAALVSRGTARPRYAQVQQHIRARIVSGDLLITFIKNSGGSHANSASKKTADQRI